MSFYPHRGPHVPHRPYVPSHHHPHLPRHHHLPPPPPIRSWGASSGGGGPGAAPAALSPGGQVLQLLGLLVALAGVGLFLSNFFLGPSVGGGPSVHDPDFWAKAQVRHREFR